MILTFPARLTVASLAFAISAQAGDLVSDHPADSRDAAFPAGNGQLATLVSGRIDSEKLPLLDHPKSGKADPQEPGSGIGGESLGTLVLDWLDAPGVVTDYQRTLNLQDGTVVTTFKRGSAGFTTTTFVSNEDDLMVIHLRTNKPGFLDFRVKLERGDISSRVEDRRVQILKGLTENGSPFEARAWIYPMESEVTPGDGEITVRGEGEALVLVAATSDPEAIPLLADRMKEFGFGGPEHPDIFKLWIGLLERQRAAHRKAMAAGPDDFASYLKIACGQ